MNQDLKLSLIIIGLLAILMINAAYNENQHPYGCVETKTVAEIISFEYRDATVKFTDGSTLQVNQATLKPGSTICTRKERS